MSGHKISLRGFRVNKKTGRIEKIEGFGLNTTAKIARKKSKKTKVVRRKP